MKSRLAYHLPRLLHQFGLPVRFGGHSFRMAGYYPSRFTTSAAAHEHFLEIMFRKALEAKPGAFIDIGVNIGQTLAKVLAIDRNRVYFGFEPQLSCCFNADQFIRANGLLNAKVIPIALGNSNQILLLHSAGETDEGASLIEQSNAPSAMLQTPVQCRVGDEALTELGITSISVIKIDVEGAEVMVIEGLKQTLATQRPTIFFEVLPNFSGMGEKVWHPPETCATNRASAKKIHGIFQQLGYEIFQIDEQSCNETKIDEFDLDCIHDFKGSNFVARPATP